MLPWYERELARYGVEVRLGTEVGDALLDELRPDVVFIATGSVPQVPQQMMDSVVNASSVDVQMIDDVLEYGTDPGRTILVVGGDQIGMQAADYLSEGGRTVFVAESHGHFAQKLAANDRWYLIARTIEKKVQRFKNVHDIEIAEDGSVQLVMPQGRQPLPRLDTIVFAGERRSDRSVAELAKQRGLETWVIGDAADVSSEDSGTIFMTIAQAYDRARALDAV